MANHGPAYGLSAELEEKRKASYNPELENQARAWIETVSGEKIGPDFGAGLKDGIILCKLANKLKAGSVAKINTGKMPFTQMENIGNFLKFAESVGVKAGDRFQTVDLFEGKNLNQVVHCIHALGRAAQKIAGYTGPTLGVKEADRHDVQFTEEQLNRGKAELGLLTAGQAKNQLSNVDRSHDVNRNYEQKW